MKKVSVVLFIAVLLSLWIPTAFAGVSEVYLSDLVPLYENNISGCLQFDREYWTPDIRIFQVLYPKGIGMSAPDPSLTPNSACRYHVQRSYTPGRGTAAWKLNGGYNRFLSKIAITDDNGNRLGTGAAVVFRVYLDDVLIFEKVRNGNDYFSELSLDVTGGNVLVLEVDAGSTGWGDQSVWPEARLQKDCQCSL